jgi:hypothetical protein
MAGWNWEGKFLMGRTTDVELLELSFVVDETGELLFGQVDDLGHLDEDLLRVGIAWGHTLLLGQLWTYVLF